MCNQCESLIAALKAANADKDRIISHLAYELAEKDAMLKAKTAALERGEGWLKDKEEAA